MKAILLAVLAAVLVGGLSPGAHAQEQEIPEWIKNTAGWWAADLISDIEYINSITWLLQNGLIVLAGPEPVQESEPTAKSNTGNGGDTIITIREPPEPEGKLNAGMYTGGVRNLLPTPSDFMTDVDIGYEWNPFPITGMKWAYDTENEVKQEYNPTDGTTFEYAGQYYKIEPMTWKEKDTKLGSTTTHTLKDVPVPLQVYKFNSIQAATDAFDDIVNIHYWEDTFLYAEKGSSEHNMFIDDFHDKDILDTSKCQLTAWDEWPGGEFYRRMQCQEGNIVFITGTYIDGWDKAVARSLLTETALKKIQSMVN